MEKYGNKRCRNYLARRYVLVWLSHMKNRFFPCGKKRRESLTQKTRKSIVKTSGTSYNKGEEKEEALKTLERLTLADRFIFFKVMQDAELCKRLLEIILGVEIERIEYPEGEKTIEVFKDAKGIRLDIYVKDGRSTVYNVEMQAAHASNLPQRSRYYQNLIDVGLLGRGKDYRLLNKSYVIFICMEDIFHKGRHIYTFEYRCREDTGLTLGDGAVKIFLNPYSDMEDVTPELRNFLRYLAEGVAVDEYTERLVEAVETAKRDPRLMVEYMSYYAEQADRRAEREEGWREGHEEGIMEGHAAGLDEGMVRGIIQTTKSFKGTMEQAAEQLVLQRGMSGEEALATVRKYW